MEDKKHQLKKLQIEGEMYDHYVKIIDKMLTWCVYEQPEDLDVITSLFAVDKRALTMKACEDVLRRWKGEGANDGAKKA